MTKELQKLVASDQQWRLAYHIMPETGWLNDPNGSVQFNGKYHVYFQYEPDNPKGGATHWGHKSSTDLVHFKEEPIFLSPDQSFDCDGAYSGSALIADNQLHFFYTGNVKHEGFNDYLYQGREQNVVHVISSDGKDILKREVVIPHQDLPAGYTAHIRDPKVFKHDSSYWMLLGGRTLEHNGVILLFESTDLTNWHFVDEFYKGDSDDGYMWECPDLVNFDSKEMIMYSPQGLAKEKGAYQNIFSSGYQLGHIDWDEKCFIPESEFTEFDYGFDFYAPQTFTDEKGRHMMWGWFGLPNIEPEYLNPTVAYGWQHALTLPRELTYQNGKLRQQVPKEYQVLRGDEQTLLNCSETSRELKGEVYEFIIEWKYSSLSSMTLHLREDTVISYDGEFLKLSHGKSGYGRKERYVAISDLSQLQIFSDYSSLEIFINDGEAVMSSRLYPEKGEDSIQFKSQRPADLTFWPLTHT